MNHFKCPVCKSEGSYYPVHTTEGETRSGASGGGLRGLTGVVGFGAGAMYGMKNGGPESALIFGVVGGLVGVTKFGSAIILIVVALLAVSYFAR